MTNNVFKQFVGVIEHAGEGDNIWYEGYMWLDMTKRQHDKVIKVLDTIGFVERVTKDDGIWYKIPSGIMIKKEVI